MGQDGLAGDICAGCRSVDGSLQNRFTHDFRLFPSLEHDLRLTPVVAGGIRGAMHPIIVIPTRLASTRLPRKPLADIGGVPMIVRVVRRALAAEIGPVVVAAGDAEILDIIRDIPGVRGVLTDSALASGSDRVHAALAEVDPNGAHDVVINLQGDLPLIEPSSLTAVLKPLEDPAFDIGTLAAPVTSEAERDASQVVKIACAFGEDAVTRALYFSRLPIPWGEGPHWHHVGVYAWRRHALERFVSLAPSALERRESLEQLRALEAGMTIGCARIDHAPQGVDTPADLEHVRGLV
ncbi:3-deoxy-D-manno-octulosonate cytidylyltransferase [Gluconobacter roseus NBRC 3990]|nr:3-deoxy-D-manno-octulosonate cytidylyltransferase [Gluconobacter roseus NBRC 3990]